tara:strand:- start:625 stop:1413 length:789 start_codon:yes stop_codon:yes gene_type:complete
MTKVIGVISVKGGVGKTTVVVNLANVLANVCKQRVLVVDANFSAPNLRLYLGLEEPKKGIHEVLQGSADLNEAIYNTSYGFHILPARLNNKCPTKVSSLGNFIDELREYYDFILIDSSPNVNAEILATVKASDDLFMVVNPDYATLSCTLCAIKIAKENRVPIEGIIVNKVYGNKNEVSFKDIEEITDSKIIAIIPHHLDIHESVLKRIPLKFNKRKEYSREYSELAKFMILCKNPSEKVKLKRSLVKTISQKNRLKILKKK